MQENESVGFLKYEGTLVKDGVMDARSAAQALRGFDSAVRYFAIEEAPALDNVEFPLPVRIQHGSWEALIPHDFMSWLKTAAGVAATTYLTKAVSKLAENGFKDETLGSVLKKSLRAVLWLIRLGKHMGHLHFAKLSPNKWDQDGMFGFTNEMGEVLYVPQPEFKKIARCPERMLSDLASVIEVERKLVVGVNENGAIDRVEVSFRERHIFAKEDDTEEIVFPQLVHGADVSLDGLVTRGNGRTNTIGFLYEGHVLNCMPDSGSIIRFKSQLFLYCKIKGVVDRMDEHGNPVERKPRIKFSSLRTLSKDGQRVFDFKDSEDKED